MATKKYQLESDLWAMLLFLATMIPTIIWYAIPAPNDVLRADSATPIIDTIGAILQPLFVILLCFVKKIDSTAKSPIVLLVAAIACLVLYYTGWAMYYTNIVTPCTLLLMTIPPCLVFILYAVAKRNLLALVPALGFAICHIIYGVVNFIL